MTASNIEGEKKMNDELTPSTGAGLRTDLPVPSECDVAVIGGGVNGLAVARDAAGRGLRTVLVERDDIGSHTSAISTRLIHGGLKYLETFQLHLVLESIRERKHLLRDAPHLVTTYPMVIPFIRARSRPWWLLSAGVILHRLLTVGHSVPGNRLLTRSRLRKGWPSITPDLVRGGALFMDASIPLTERLLVELALDAADHGTTVLTRARVVKIQPTDTGIELTVKNTTSGTESKVRASAVVNAAGPWVDRVLATAGPAEPMIGGTKGSHVVVESFPGAPRTCVFFEASSDSRPMFVLPWRGRYMLGTTDIPFQGSLENITASEAEISYLLSEVNALIPAARLTRQDVRWSYSGVRPLPRPSAGTKTGAVTRDFKVVGDSAGIAGLFSIVGGKFTTHRALGEDVVDRVAAFLGRPNLRSETARRPFPGAHRGPVGWSQAREDYLAGSRLSAPAAQRLVEIYGTRAALVEALAISRSDLAETVDPATGALAAEIVFAVEQEGARSLADILLRRTTIGLNSDLGIGALPAIESVLRNHLGWDLARISTEQDDYRSELSRFGFVADGIRPPEADPTVVVANSGRLPTPSSRAREPLPAGPIEVQIPLPDPAPHITHH